MYTSNTNRLAAAATDTHFSNVPWNLHPAFPPGTAEQYTAAFEAAMGSLVDNDARIDFISDTWDFRPFVHHSNSSSLCISFANLPEDVKTKVKFFAAYSIGKGVKISSVRTRVAGVKRVICSLVSKGHYVTIGALTTDDIIREVESHHNVKSSARETYYTGSAQFIDFLRTQYPDEPLLIDQDVLFERASEERRKVAQYGEKTPNIPMDYLNIIIRKATEVMREEDENVNMRMTAAMLIILSQTGLRVGDALVLHADDLRVTTLPKSGLTVHYLHYRSSKPSKPDAPLLEFDIFSNDLCTEAFECICTLKRRYFPSLRSSEFAFVLCDLRWKKGGRDDDQYHPLSVPVSPNNFGVSMQRFFLEHLEAEASIPRPGIAPCKIKRTTSQEPKDHVLYIPLTRQYRVAVCTYLYNHNVPLTYIMKFMGHLSEQMRGYYVRPTDRSYEEAEYRERTLNEIIKEDATPIGYLGDDLVGRAKEWLAAQNVSVKADIKEIADSIGDNMIIRPKLGGVCTCIRNSYLPCADDKRTNDALCAYGECRNIYTFYYNADLTYLDFVTAVQCCEALEAQGKTLAAPKEYATIKRLIQQRMQPQLNELIKMVSEKGREYVVGRFPSLADIIDRREEIQKEIDAWVKK